MPDRADIAKRIERAEKFLQKGKPEAALEEYLSVLHEDRDNDSVRQMAADLSVGVGRVSEAVRLLGELFERQVALGDSGRASLTYKKLARFCNPSIDQKIRFGQILEATNRKLALETYEGAIFELSSRGNKDAQMQVLKRVVALDPTMQNFTRMGELSAELGDQRGAAAAFLRVAELTEQSGGAASGWYERAYQADATNPKVALAYGRCLLAQGEAGAAIFVLDPLMAAGNAGADLRDVYAKALLAASRFTDAEPHVWLLFEQNPGRIQQVTQLIGSMLDAQLDDDAVALARKLEQHQRRRGERRAFLGMMQDLVTRHRASPAMLEFLAEFYNSSNRESDYCQTLLRLFDLYFKTGNFTKAGECLDRAAEVDPYESGHHRRLDSLKGKIGDEQFKVISARLAPTVKGESDAAKHAEPAMSATLQDLILQAEILVQYGMNQKATERLTRIQELFPGEVQHNQDLQRLFVAVGLAPQPPKKPAAPAVPSGLESVVKPVVAVSPPPVPPPPPAADLNQLARIAEISRQLYRQNDSESVLSVLAKEVAELWKATRCLVAMRKRQQQATAFQEFHTSGSKPADARSAVKIATLLDDLVTQKGGPVAVPDANTTQELDSIHSELMDLNAASVLALPMGEGEERAGVLVLVQDVARSWHTNDIVVLRTITEQAAVALKNVGLRRLVTHLSVTDEKSGLLSRSSYLDVLQGEARRAQDDNTALTVMLLHFGNSAHAIKIYGEDVVEDVMQQAGRVLASHIRQNDFAFRYDTTTIALVLGQTHEADAAKAVEKFRRLLSDVKLPGQDEPVSYATGIAEAVTRQHFDAADIVTELINRVEQALELACESAPHVQALPSSFAKAAVA